MNGGHGAHLEKPGLISASNCISVAHAAGRVKKKVLSSPDDSENQINGSVSTPPTSWPVSQPHDTV